jgi:SAM-dependent methyltransferase
MVMMPRQVLSFTPGFAIQAARRILGRYVASQREFRARVAGRFGLEIGGPSKAFQDDGMLPLYRYVESLDNCVFAMETIWEGSRAEGLAFSYHPRKAKGFNFIRETTNLHGIPERRYDFVLSSHSLEHTANPRRALREWMRVIKPSGTVIVLLPDYRHTFDHRRRPTSIQHMLEDDELTRDEKDMTHLQEILELHDLARDRAAGSRDLFHERSLQNYKNRCLHHHVFDEVNTRQLLESAGLTVEIIELVKPHHIVTLARCP